ncbi:MAG: GxxExxY protein [Muribaculaceae bacterium]|nr:GxxExxY protein [Muribaculaceae bacterium]
MDEDKIIYDIIGACRKVNKNLGYGLIERVYQLALMVELKRMGYEVASEVYVDFKYNDSIIEKAFRLDLLVNNKIIIELKALEEMPGVCFNQLYSYLKITNLKNGILVNFGEYNFIKKGTYRINTDNWINNSHKGFWDI